MNEPALLTGGEGEDLHLLLSLREKAAGLRSVGDEGGEASESEDEAEVERERLRLRRGGHANDEVEASDELDVLRRRTILDASGLVGLLA